MTMWLCVYKPVDGVTYSAICTTIGLARRWCDKYGAKFEECASRYVVIESTDQLY